MKIVRLFVGVYFCLLFLHANAQVLPYAKEIVKSLSSPAMKGRGYVAKGEHKAADFIVHEFKTLGGKKFQGNYKQQFGLSVNTFPNAIKLAVNSVELISGADFLIDPGSSGITGVFATITISADELLNDEIWRGKVKESANKFIVIQSFNKELYTKDQVKKIQEVVSSILSSATIPAKGFIIVTNDKLTWSTSLTVNSKPIFTIKASAVKDSIKQVQVNVRNKFIEEYKTQNLVSYIEGARQDSLVVLTAHYDHLGMMGQALFPGANDNASGVSMLLSLMKYYGLHKPLYTTVFIAFGGEEIGLKGSEYFVSHPLVPLAKIKFLINFDMAGTGDDGIQIVNGKVFKKKFEIISQLNTKMNLLPQIKNRGEACNSDHCFFYKNNVPCFFIYTLGGIQAYHDIDDKAETLPFTGFENYFKLMTAFIDQL